MNGRGAALSFLFGGLLPVIAFTVIEERYGPYWGVIAGMVFGVGEILWEWITQKKISGITLGGNALILILGGISIWAGEGIWFKLQPAIMEAVMAVALLGSIVLGRPLLILLAEKQKVEIPAPMRAFYPGLTLRLGLFFLAHAILATYAALYWSTNAWAILKGVGFTISFFVYFGIELFIFRAKMKRNITS